MLQGCWEKRVVYQKHNGVLLIWLLLNVDRLLLERRSNRKEVRESESHREHREPLAIRNSFLITNGKERDQSVSRPTGCLLQGLRKCRKTYVFVFKKTMNKSVKSSIWCYYTLSPYLILLRDGY